MQVLDFKDIKIPGRFGISFAAKKVALISPLKYEGINWN
jgi:hypothetical protein